MTNAELIAKIKAEIERLKGQLIRGSCAAQIEMGTSCKEEAYDEVLSFLSTLESEKPMNQDEVLNEEIKKEMANLPFFIRGKDQIAFARHFAKWGADHTPLPEDTVLFQKGVAEGKRLMMEEAVKWLVDDDYHELTEKGRFILGSVGIGYNGYYIPYSDLLKLPKED